MTSQLIEKKLKNYTWTFNEETKELVITSNEQEVTIVLDKIRWFSLFRFMIRASQRMSTPRRNKSLTGGH